MFRSGWIRIAVGCFAALGLARAEDTKPIRPPPDYSGRVQLYETPATIAPPKTPRIPEDRSKLESRDAAPELFARPTPLSLVPEPPMQSPDSERYWPSRARDLLQDGWERTPDTKNSNSGWGWLADEISTNRARRAAAQSKSSRTADEEDEEGYGAMTNQGAAAQAEGAANREKASDSQTDRQSADPDPALGWWAEPDPAQSATEDAKFASTAARADDAAARIERSREWSYLDAHRGWTPSVSMTMTLQERDAADRAAVESEQRTRLRSVEREQSRAALDERFSDPGRFLRAESTALVPPSGFPAVSTFETPAFTPFSLAPVDPPLVTPTPTPPLSVSVSPLGSTPTPSGSLGGLGTENERLTPKTLPW